MQQRVSDCAGAELAADLLLMDEPFGALDEITRDKLNLHLTDLWRERNLTVIFVTHSIPRRCSCPHGWSPCRPIPGGLAG